MERPVHLLVLAGLRQPSAPRRGKLALGIVQREAAGRIVRHDVGFGVRRTANCGTRRPVHGGRPEGPGQKAYS